MDSITEKFFELLSNIASPNYVWEIFIAILTGIVSFLVALFVFWNEKRRDEINEAERLKDVRMSLYYGLDFTSKAIQQQIDEIEIVLDFFTKNKIEPFPIISIPPVIIGSGLDPYQFKNFLEKDLYVILIKDKSNKKERIKNYQLFLNNLPVLIKSENSLNEIHKNVYNDYMVMKNKIYPILNKINNIIRKGVLFENGIPKGKDRLFDLLMHKLEKYNSDHNGKTVDLRDIYIYSNDIFVSVAQYSLLEGKNETNEKLMKLTKKIEYFYYDMIDYNSTIEESFENIKQNLQMILNNFNEIIKIEYGDSEDL